MFSVIIEDIDNDGLVPEEHAYCVGDGLQSTRDGGNLSPAISWNNAPEGTRSFALMMCDPDAPRDMSQARRPDVTIAEDAPRRTFHHWLLTDIPAEVNAIPAGETGGAVKGANDFGERAKGANGYDGPCPPWNDARIHTYHFIVLALDVPTLGLNEGFNAGQMIRALEGHVLARAEVAGRYTTRLAALSGG